MTTATATQPTAQKNLNARHYKECIEKRGLDAQWVLANCRSVTAMEATQRLGYTAQSDGIWLEGCNHQSQFKPDKPWKSEGDHKAAKYRSPLGEIDAMLPTHPTDPYYWDDIKDLKQRAFNIDGHPCLLLTEGFFKAIMGCNICIPTIALLGVEMGLTSKDADPQGKRYLVATLERYARAGLGFLIAFDADCATNQAVIEALIPPGCPPIIAVLAANQYFEPAERVEASTLHAAELGINRLHLYAIAVLKAGVGGEG